MRKSAFALLVVVAFVSVAVLAQVAGTASMSPLQRWAAEGRISFNAQGGLTVHGGQFTKDMQEILFPPPAPTNYTLWSEVVSPYPTMAVKGDVKPIERKAPDPVSDVHALGTAFTRWLGPMPDWGGVLRGFVDSTFGLFTMDARAACGAGAGSCFRIAVGNWNAANSWSATSGGASCGAACVPAATDAVTFDTGSGGGTVTLVAATTIASLTMSGAGSGTLSAGASNFALNVNGNLTIGASATLSSNGTITVAGNWDTNAAAGWNFGSGTVILSATGTLRTFGTIRTNYFNNLTINVSVTTTMTTNIGVANVLTVNGTLTGSNYLTLINALTAPSATPLVLGASGSVSGATGVIVATDSNVNIAAATYKELYIETFATGATVNWTATAQGNIVVTSDLVVYNSAAFTATLAMAANNLTANSTTALGSGITYPLHVGFALTFGILTFTTGVLSVTAAVNGNGVQIPNATSYISFGSGSHTVAGQWQNSSTSASWGAGTGTVTFNAAASVTMTFANLGANEFNNVTFDQGTGGIGIVYTMGGTNALKAGGLMTITRTVGTGTVTLDTTASNLGIASGGVTIAANGALTGNGSTLTISGNFNFSAGTFTYGTSTVVFAASGTITAPTWVSQRSVYNLTVNLGVSMTIPDTVASVGISNAITVNGTVVFGTGVTVIAFTMFNDTGTANPLVLGASGAFTGTADNAEIEFADVAGALTNIPAGNYGNAFLKIGPQNTVAGDGHEYRVLGNLTVDRFLLSVRAGDPYFINTQTFNLNIRRIDDYQIGTHTTAFGIKATSGTWTQTGGITISTVNGANFYLQLGSIAWTFTGTTSGFAWSLGTVTGTSNWNVGTSAVTFNVVNGAGFRFTAAAVNNFNNVTFRNAGSGLRYFAYTNDTTNPLLVAGTLTVSDSTTTTVFDTVNTAGSPINVTAGSIVVGTGGSFKANSSTITANGNVTLTGTFTRGTSTLVLAANGAIAGCTNGGSTITAPVNPFFNLTVNVGVTATITTVSCGIYGTTTVNGALTGTGQLFMRGAIATPLVIGASGSVAGLGGGMNFTPDSGAVNFNVPGGTYASIYFDSYSGTVTQRTATMTGNVVITASFDLGDGTDDSQTILNNGGFNLTATGLALRLGQAPDSGGIVLTTGTVSVGNFVIYGGSPSFGGSFVNFGNATVNVSAEIRTGPAPGSNTAYLIFGNSTINLAGVWTNVSTSASWSTTGTAVINFTGTGTLTLADVAGGIALPEFPTVNIKGTYTVSGTLSFKTANITGSTTFGGGVVVAGGGVTIGLAASSYAQLTKWNTWAPAGPNIDFILGVTPTTGTLTITVTNVSQTVAVFVDGVYQATAATNGNQQTVTVVGPWSTHDITLASPPPPGGGGGGGGGGKPPAPVVSFTVALDGATYTFTATAPTGYTFSLVVWDFGDGGSGSGTPIVHTFVAGAQYAVTAQATFNNGYKASATVNVSPVGPSMPDWLPALIVVAAIVALVLVFASESENRRIWLSIVSLAVFWAAFVYVSATNFPSLVPRSTFAYFPLAVAAVAGLMAAEKANHKKLVWIGIAVAAIVVWAVKVAGVIG